MHVISSEEKLRQLIPASRLLERCNEALRQSVYLGAVVKLEETDREEDIDLVKSALFLAGWRIETVAEYPPGHFTRSDSGNQLRIREGITGDGPKTEAAAGGGGGGH